MEKETNKLNCITNEYCNLEREGETTEKNYPR